MERELCPHCGQPTPIKYKYPLDDMDVSVLLKIWHEVIRQGSNKIDIRQLDLSYAERSRITQLRFHALVAKVRNTKGTQIPGNWLITKRGSDFLHGKLAVPAYVWTQNNHVIDHAKELIRRSDFKVLKDFQATYEIVDNMVLKIPQYQLNLF